MFESGPILWIIVIAGGAFLLALVIAYGKSRNRTTTPEEDLAAERKTRELYHKDESRPH